LWRAVLPLGLWFGPEELEGSQYQSQAGPSAELVGKLHDLSDPGRVRVLLEIMGGNIPVLFAETLIVSSVEGSTKLSKASPELASR
jgi:hypothetical protein